MCRDAILGDRLLGDGIPLTKKLAAGRSYIQERERSTCLMKHRHEAGMIRGQGYTKLQEVVIVMKGESYKTGIEEIGEIKVRMGS